MSRADLTVLAKLGLRSFLKDEEPDPRALAEFEAHLAIIDGMGRLRTNAIMELGLCFGVELANATAIRLATKQVSGIICSMETIAAVNEAASDPVATWMTSDRGMLPPRIGYFDGAIGLEAWLTVASQAKAQAEMTGGNVTDEATGTRNASTGLDITKVERSAPDEPRFTLPEIGRPPTILRNRISILVQVGDVFREAWRQLQTRERVLLRLRVVDGIAAYGIGPVYAVPASRIARWELQARERFARGASAGLRRLAMAREITAPEEFVPAVLGDFDFWLALQAAEESMKEAKLREPHGSAHPPQSQ